MDVWNDGELALESTPKLLFSAPTSKYGKQIFTATIPYNSENRFLYRTLISKMKWFRYVFDNESYNNDGFIVRRSNTVANQLFLSTANADQTTAIKEIIEEVVQYRYVKPLDGNIHTAKYKSSMTKVVKFNVDYDNFNGRDEAAGSDMAFEIGRATGTQVHSYPLKSGCVVVIQGRDADRAKALKMTKLFAKCITDKMLYDEARAMALSLEQDEAGAEEGEEAEEVVKVKETPKYIPAILKKPMPPPPATPPTPQPTLMVAEQVLAAPLEEIALMRPLADIWSPLGSNNTNACVRCGSAPRRVLSLPCAHLALCVTCADVSVARREIACPLCAMAVANRILIYLV
jgi:hypothetical protein